MWGLSVIGGDQGHDEDAAVTRINDPEPIAEPASGKEPTS
ncbi:hypothetical protein Sros_4078 [Streptosporangium roseum DSM 43021]|uniref:Uncharacterized protein n=1 Tax=Streptosporangium roseum (strain ATCC 12428 / DSM 43021 / JCM 3005 / KCTC 9067 / NCIMB 10171 / NRRL 2505 / NI 9100) TaxID=479432 RepID=D2AWJ0_STRRD|nr:hypothetical protein Sros_4078 [Streptosporangium roseum DSM 43021]